MMPRRIYAIHEYCRIPEAPVIYCIRRIDTGDEYIGSAVNLRDRFRLHVWQLRNGVHHSPRLQNAFTKHGPDAFEIEIVEWLHDKADAILAEQLHLDARNPIYNTLKVAGSAYGRKMTADGKAKIGAKNRGRSPSKETRALQRKAKIGKPLAIVTRVKMSMVRRRARCLTGAYIKQPAKTPSFN